MRKVWHLVGRYHRVDNRRAINGKSLVNLGVQLARLRGPKATSAASTGECTEIRIREFDSFPESRQTDGLGFQRNETKGRVVVDDDLHREFVMHSGEELAHKHVE